MIDAKAKIALKITDQIPEASIEGKRAIVTLSCNGQAFRADLNAKSYRKGCVRAEEFERFVIAIDGDFDGVSNGVLRMSGCGFQVFERKEKEPKAEQTEAPPAEPKQAPKPLEKPQAQTKGVSRPPRTTDKEGRNAKRSELPPNLFDRSQYEKMAGDPNEAKWTGS